MLFLGRITSDGSNTYTYDEYGQLIRENNKWLDKTFIYEYNGDGNLTSVKTYGYTNNNEELPSSYSEQSYSYNTTHPDRMISFGTASVSYNSYGYPTSYKGKALTWSNGRLATVTSGTNVYYYTYNALGQRIKKECRNSGVLNSQTTYSYDNAGRLISEIQTKNIGTTSETGIETIYLYDESGMIGMSRAGTACYFYRNLQGDVTDIYTSGGNSLAKYGYEAYGKCTVLAGTNDYNLANANPIRYRGYYFDAETGFYCLGARYYDPQARRFISPDDTAYIDPESVNGLNLYCYCNNDPVNFVDPSGHMAISTAIIIGAVIGGVVGLGTVAYTDYADDGMIFNGSVGIDEYLLGGATGALLGGSAGAIIKLGGIYLAGAIKGVFSKALTDSFAYFYSNGNAQIGSIQDYALAFVAGGFIPYGFNKQELLLWKMGVDILARPALSQAIKIGLNASELFDLDKLESDVMIRSITNQLPAPYKQLIRGIIRGYGYR